jgi:hypothetical protein
MTKQENKTKEKWGQNVKAKWNSQQKLLSWVGTSFVSHNGQSQILLLFFMIQKPNKCKNWSCEQLTFVHEMLWNNKTTIIKCQPMLNSWLKTKEYTCFLKNKKIIHLFTNLEKVGDGCVKTLTHHKFKVGTF